MHNGPHLQNTGVCQGLKGLGNIKLAAACCSSTHHLQAHRDQHARSLKALLASYSPASFSNELIFDAYKFIAKLVTGSALCKRGRTWA